MGLGLCVVCSSWGMKRKCGVVYDDICEICLDFFVVSFFFVFVL